MVLMLKFIVVPNIVACNDDLSHDQYLSDKHVCDERSMGVFESCH